MPFPLLATAIVGSGVLGSILGNRKAARTGTSTPIEPKEFTPLRDVLLQQAMRRANMATPTGALQARGINNINQNADLFRQALENRLTSQGLANSPVAGSAMAQAESKRFGDISGFQNIDLPLLEQEYGNRNLQSALQVFNSRRTGMETVNPGSPTGAGFSSAAELLAFLYGQGAFAGAGA